MSGAPQTAEEWQLFPNDQLSYFIRLLDDGSFQVIAEGEILTGGRAIDHWRFSKKNGKWTHEAKQARS